MIKIQIQQVQEMQTQYIALERTNEREAAGFRFAALLHLNSLERLFPNDCQITPVETSFADPPQSLGDAIAMFRIVLGVTV